MSVDRAHVAELAWAGYKGNAAGRLLSGAAFDDAPLGESVIESSGWAAVPTADKRAALALWECGQRADFEEVGLGDAGALTVRRLG